MVEETPTIRKRPRATTADDQRQQEEQGQRQPKRPRSSGSHAATNDDKDEDETSSSGSSSSSSSSASVMNASEQEEEGIPYISGRSKPFIHRPHSGTGLVSRISAFLPQLRDANDALQREILAGRVGDVAIEENNESGQETGREYIEMVCLLDTFFFFCATKLTSLMLG